jgi:hypothetical protein
VAKKITEETGGRSITVNNEKHLAEAFDQISEELRSQYTLGYYPTNTARDGKFRKIKVDMGNHDWKSACTQGILRAEGVASAACQCQQCPRRSCSANVPPKYR